MDMIIEHGTFVVAADGGGAVVYRNAGHEGAAKLEVVETHDAHNKSFTREVGSDRPGRMSTPGGGKTAVAGPDYHDQAEREFAKRLATRLDELIGAHVHGKDQAKVVLFASPRFLGMIRSDYSARLKGALKAEIGKDLREAAPKQIEHALTELDHA
jgi:protein required for attachment to host cells